MLKLPSYMFSRERTLLSDTSRTDDQRRQTMLSIVDQLVQADIEWRLLSGGIERVGYPTVSPSATLGNVGGGDSGYDVLDYEAEKIQQRGQMAICAREMMVQLHDRQHAALLLASYPSRSPRGVGTNRVGAHNSRALSLDGVAKLQQEIAKELGFYLASEFGTSMAIRKASARARASMCNMVSAAM